MVMLMVGLCLVGQPTMVEAAGVEESLRLAQCLLLQVLMSIGTLVLEMLLVYRTWYNVRQGHVGSYPCCYPTPTKAAWYMLIPLYNLYWQFIIFGELPAAAAGTQSSFRLPRLLFRIYPVWGVAITIWNLPLVGESILPADMGGVAIVLTYANWVMFLAVMGYMTCFNRSLCKACA